MVLGKSNYFESLLNAMESLNLEDKSQSIYHHVKNESDKVIIEVSLAGYSKDKLDIKYEDLILTISYDGEESLWVKKFKKTFSLKNVRIDVNSIKSTFINGILTISMSKTEEYKGRQINIE